MTNISLTRRRLVSAAPAAVVAASLPAIAASVHTDVELARLGAKLETVHAKREAFDKAYPEADYDPYYGRHWQLREAINQIPATTTAGLAVKARAAQIALDNDPGNECEGDGSFRNLSCSLIDDLLKMVATGGAHA